LPPSQMDPGRHVRICSSGLELLLAGEWRSLVPVPADRKNTRLKIDRKTGQLRCDADA
jgi:hypothetical protein